VLGDALAVGFVVAQEVDVGRRDGGSNFLEALIDVVAVPRDGGVSELVVAVQKVAACVRACKKKSETSRRRRRSERREKKRIIIGRNRRRRKGQQE